VKEMAQVLPRTVSPSGLKSNQIAPDILQSEEITSSVRTRTQGLRPEHKTVVIYFAQ